VYFGEKPYADRLQENDQFIHRFVRESKKFSKDSFGWEAEIEGEVKYLSENIINIEIKHYTY
jgi:hypothetical protein